ncbi:hypothetical protein HYV72_00285 [Candidatus Uhrbacteria bacterium]|nr:hypothetical protein [Candidatus Uhrbacteria bacterium]
MATRKKTNTKSRQGSKGAACTTIQVKCPTCHPMAGSHIVSMLLVTLFAVGAVLMTAVVSLNEKQQQLTAQAAYIESVQAAQ